ncbi:MAG TPA: DUF1223 domain-containing protein, partial [Bryobacteraceae bacterium]|nr:DUF1223 domain-containing protein [Bryobacteraceae bacterium]
MNPRYIFLLAFAAVGLAVLAITAAPHPIAGNRPAPTGDQPAAPVVVELFTSEGCSSCPPADRLLALLDEKQPVPGARIIALEQHVDYWDDLGWRDPFSSAQFSRRQEDYVSAFHTNGAYTPQMVVDGSTELLGSDPHAALAAIVKSSHVPKTSIVIGQTNPVPPDAASIPVRVSLESAPSANAASGSDVILAVTEDNLLSNVTNGENSGSKLPHRAVVRDMRVLGRVGGDGSFNAQTDVRLSKNWKR